MAKKENKNQKKLIKLLNSYKSIAQANQKKHPFKTYESYYRGSFDANITNVKNNYNITKSLVDTKTTFVLDNHVTTSIIPKYIHFANEDTINDMLDIADILEDVKNEVYKDNDIKSLNYKVTRRGIINNVGIVKVFWDEDFGELGNVRLEEIPPSNFFPDPSAKDVQSANYIYIKYNYSILTLKKKYPHLTQEIDELAKKGNKDITSDTNKGEKTGVITAQTDKTTSQIYAQSGKTEGIESAAKTLDVWECFIKDNSIFAPDENDNEDEKEVKEKAKLVYPNGRVIVYSGESLIFEDKAIDYPFGFPISMFYENPGDSILPEGGTVRDLMYIQDRLNRAYSRQQYLLGKFLSIILIDGASGVNKQDFARTDVIELAPESLARGLDPKILTNNTINELQAVSAYITDLKENAREIARVNDQMISGERQHGVTSGEMVQALNESAMTGIRQVQRNYMDFTVDLTNKIIVLIQKYYNVERIIKITTGSIIKFPLRTENQEEQQPIQVIDFKDRVAELTKEIKSDLADFEFKTEIIAGTEMPKSRTQFAALTLQLAEQGVFGDINSIDVKEQVLTALDYPNRRAIIQKLQEEEKKALEDPVPPDAAMLIEKMGLNFKDLSLDTDQLDFSAPQKQLLKQLGLSPVPIPEPPLPPPLPGEDLGIPGLPPENITPGIPA